MRCDSATQSLHFARSSPSHTDAQISPVARVLFCGNNILNERNFPVYHGENRIGRDRASHIFLPSLHLSRIHACIFFQSGFSFLSDCNSHNGSFRSTLRLTPHFRYELFDGTRFSLGDLSFIYYTDPLNGYLCNRLNQQEPGQIPPLILSCNDENYLHSINSLQNIKMDSTLSMKQKYHSSPFSESDEVPNIFGGDNINTTVSLINYEKSQINSYLLTLEKCIDCYETTQIISVFNDFDIERELNRLPTKSLVYDTSSLPKTVPLISETDYIELSFMKSTANISPDYESINTLGKIGSSCLSSDHYPNELNDAIINAFVNVHDKPLIDAFVNPSPDTVRNGNYKFPLSNLATDYLDLKRDDLPINNNPFKVDYQKIPINFIHDYVSKMDDIFPVNFDSGGVAPVIIFTFILEEKYRTIVTKLGGRITTDVFEATHLITDKIRRTIKFLCCLARGCEILCADWLIKSKVAGKFLEANPFRIQDKVNESKYNFILKDSCEKASVNQMFSGYLFFLTTNILPNHQEMERIIYSSGGKIINCLKDHNVPFLLITCEKDLPLVYRTLGNPLPNKIKFLSTEFVLTGVLRQSVNFYNFSFFQAKHIKSNYSNHYPKRKKRC